MTLHPITLDTAISGLPPDMQTALRHILFQGALIPTAQVAEWLNILDMEVGNLMIALLPLAAAYARVPISGFHVGAVALGMPPRGSIAGPGNLYLGSNMEFSGQALSFCVHGEQSATNHAWLKGETGLQALAINAAPCGYCRQFLYELTTATKGLNILLKASQDPNDFAYTQKPLTDFLPDAFGPQDLGVQGGLMELEFHGLTLSGGGPMAQAALDDANASYAPYTKNYCGVAVKGPDDRIYVGRYAENAAYNPSLSPLESALALMNMSLPPQTDLTITEAVLVEAKTHISQKDATQVVLSSMAPSVTLQYFALDEL